MKDRCRHLSCGTVTSSLYHTTLRCGSVAVDLSVAVLRCSLIVVTLLLWPHYYCGHTTIVATLLAAVSRRNVA